MWHSKIGVFCIYYKILNINFVKLWKLCISVNFWLGAEQHIRDGGTAVVGLAGMATWRGGLKFPLSDFVRGGGGNVYLRRRIGWGGWIGDIASIQSGQQRQRRRWMHSPSIMIPLCGRTTDSGEEMQVHGDSWHRGNTTQWTFNELLWARYTQAQLWPGFCVRCEWEVMQDSAVDTEQH